jgi:hypothetical protein
LFHTPKGNQTEYDRPGVSVDGPSAAAMMAGGSSSKLTVRPLIFCILPETVCERYSRETEGTIRSVMSLNAVVRSRAIQESNFENRPGVGIQKPSSAGSQSGHSYRNSSRISLPLVFQQQTGAPRSGEVTPPPSTAAPAAASALNTPFSAYGDATPTGRGGRSTPEDPLSALSYRYFPRAVMTWSDMSGIYFELTGWVEVLNRSSGQLQMAYLLSCEIPDEYDPESDHTEPVDSRIVFSQSTVVGAFARTPRARRFTVLRTGAQILETVKAIFDHEDAKALVDGVMASTQRLMRAANDEGDSHPDDNSGDLGDEPSWATDSHFTSSAPPDERSTAREASPLAKAETGPLSAPKSADSAAGAEEQDIGIICPRHQSAADHSFQLLAALLVLAQRRELMAEAAAREGDRSSADPKVSAAKATDLSGVTYPTRRLLLNLVASTSDILSLSFVSDQSQIDTPSSASKRNERAMRKSVSSGDLSLTAEPLVQSVIVARALWDFHWREESVHLYSSYIAFYALKQASERGKSAIASPASAPTLTLLLMEVTSVSIMDDYYVKIPGFHVMRLETVGRVVYLTFSSTATCRSFLASVLELKSAVMSSIYDTADIPAGLAMGDPRDSFVLRSGRWKPMTRMVLNSRRFLFDLEQQQAVSRNKSGPSKQSLMISYASATPPSEQGASTSVPQGTTYWSYSAKLLCDVALLSDSISRSNSRTDSGRRTKTVVMDGDVTSDGDRTKILGS